MLSSTLSTSLLPSQVGGHPGVLTTGDGSLIIKSALPNEISFYQTVAVDPGFQPLRDFVPQFYGTLRLEGQIDPDADGNDLGSVKPVEGVADHEKDEYSIVLENLTFTFLKPNVLDVKLGTVLYDDDATAEKKERMDKVARETTSAETGIRLTGFQVYDLARNQPIFTPKIYGKSIKPADLPDGIARFFPLPSNSQAPPPEPSSPSGSNEIETFKHEHGTGLPVDILIPMLTEMRSEVEEIRDALSKVDVRMVGASLLIVYEADWERAREGMRLLHEYQNIEADSEKGVEEDEEDEEDDGDDSESESPGPPFVIRLIDFAHTKIVREQGRDEGVLLGLDTVMKLLDGRIEQIKASSLSANAPHPQNPQHTLKSNTYTPVASHGISDLTELVSMSTSLDIPKDIART